MNKQTNLLDLDRPSMETYFINIDEKPFRATQVIKWIHQQGTVDFNHMSNLSLSLREKLSRIACITLPEIVSQHTSSDGTHKWLIRVNGGSCIETVFIPENERGTLCLSSQVGCPLDCGFCATGKQDFNRNLSVAEIIGQVWIANNSLGYFKDRQRIISNIVMMGMGEPLLNFDNVVMAMNLMMDDLAYGLAHKRVTLSTSGVVPGIEKLGLVSNVSLAVSLHASNDKLRNVLVPLNRKYPINKLLAASRKYSRAQSGDPITFEYVMLDGINDGDKEAHTLAELLKDFPAKVNLIPFNPFPGTEYKCSKLETINRFREILMNSGIITLTRKTRGDDIDAACGQLVGKVYPRSRKFQSGLLEHTI